MGVGPHLVFLYFSFHQLANCFHVDMEGDSSQSSMTGEEGGQSRVHA